AWCAGTIPLVSDTGRRTRADARTCSKACRQADWRFGVGSDLVPATDPDHQRPMLFAYADPPYPGKAGYYPENEEVDHPSLIDRLTTDYPDGWALSTSSAALQAVLAACPPGVRICAWHKGPRRTKARRALQAWEPLVVAGGRPLATDVVQDLSDSLIEQGRYRAFPNAMVGMKPPTYATWLFGQLGAGPGDTLHDLYPGSGAVAEAWARYVGNVSRAAAAPRDVSPLQEQLDVAPAGDRDGSPATVAGGDIYRPTRCHCGAAGPGGTCFCAA